MTNSSVPSAPVLEHTGQSLTLAQRHRPGATACYLEMHARHCVVKQHGRPNRSCVRILVRLRPGLVEETCGDQVSIPQVAAALARLVDADISYPLQSPGADGAVLEVRLGREGWGGFVNRIAPRDQASQERAEKAFYLQS